MGFVIVPGIGGSGDEHWQTAWEASLPGARRIAPASWDQPRLADWMRAIGEAVDAAASDPVIIAHSLGCLAAAEWVALHPGRVSGVLLVAPPDVDAVAFPEEAIQFRGIAGGPIGVPAILLYSEDDPYAAPEHATALAERWGAQACSVGSHGHVNSASGLGAWPEGLTHLDDLLATHPA